MRDLTCLLCTAYFYFQPIDFALCLLTFVLAVSLYRLTHCKRKRTTFLLLLANSCSLGLHINSTENTIIFLSFFVIGLTLTVLFLSIREKQFAHLESLFVLLVILFGSLRRLRGFEATAVVGGVCAAATFFGYYLQVECNHRGSIWFWYKSHTPFHIFNGSACMCREKEIMYRSTLEGAGLYRRWFTNNWDTINYNRRCQLLNKQTRKKRNSLGHMKKDPNQTIQEIYFYIRNIDLCRVNMRWTLLGSVQIFVTKTWLLGMKLILILAIKVIVYMNNK